MEGPFYRGFMNNDPPPELSDEASLSGDRSYKAALAPEAKPKPSKALVFFVLFVS